MREKLDVNGVELCAETLGDPRDPAILLIAGAHCSMDWWDEELCARLCAGGRSVIRYDHRDTGQSTASPAGAPGYGFDDLVGDATGLLDRLAVERTHLAGISMGGAIAQRVALEQPARVASVTLIATSPGMRPGARPDQDLPPMAPALLAHHTRPQPAPDWSDRDASIAALVASQRRLAGEGAFDEPRVRELAARVVDRSIDVAAAQTNHSIVEPGRPYRDRLPEIGAPALVIHGTADPLFPPGHGEATAREIASSELVLLDRVGHQPPPVHTWDTVVPALLRHTAAGPDL
jgi:pimeloyl-ACP methyl ester carboxylesterase